MPKPLMQIPSQFSRERGVAVAPRPGHPLPGSRMDPPQLLRWMRESASDAWWALLPFGVLWSTGLRSGHPKSSAIPIQGVGLGFALLHLFPPVRFIAAVDRGPGGT